MNADGTYDIAYDDGDAEQSVQKDLIEVLEVLKVGDIVTCRYAGGEQAFPAKIAGINDDGTYNVAYDDGDSEGSVSRALITRQ